VSSHGTAHGSVDTYYSASSPEVADSARAACRCCNELPVDAQSASVALTFNVSLLSRVLKKTVFQAIEAEVQTEACSGR